MEERELKSLLMQRLHLELLLFKDRILLKEKEDIFKSSYEIEIHVDLYEILVERADLLKKEALRGLLHLNTGILGSFYQEWMDRKDGSYEELSAYVGDRLELLSEMEKSSSTGEKEDDDGTGYDQAA